MIRLGRSVQFAPTDIRLHTLPDKCGESLVRRFNLGDLPQKFRI